MPTPAELNLGHGELPKTMQVNFVQLEKKAERPAAGCRAGTDAAEDRGTQTGAAEAEAGGKPKQAETQAQTGGKRHSQGQAEAGTQTQAGTRAEHGSIQPAQPVRAPRPRLPSGRGQTRASGSQGSRPAKLSDSDIKPLGMAQPVYPRMAQAREFRAG